MRAESFEEVAMRFARGIVTAVAVLAAGAAAAQQDAGLQAAASAGGLFGQGPMMYGAQAGVAFTLPDGRIQIRYLAQYYGSGSYGLPAGYGGPCIGPCPPAAATNQIVGMSMGARFNVFPSEQAPYLLASAGLYQSRFAVATSANGDDPFLAGSRQQFMTTGVGAGGGIGMNFDIGVARLYGEVQVMYTTFYHGTNAPSFIVPLVVGIGF
jgi:hypothetical protein